MTEPEDKPAVSHGTEPPRRPPSPPAQESDAADVAAIDALIARRRDVLDELAK